MRPAGVQNQLEESERMDGLFERKQNVEAEVHDVRLSQAGDEDLARISSDMGIGLSPEEMKRVASHFTSIGRDPTDVELQALGQAWSEHCCYKSSKAILKETVFGIEAPQNMVVISEDAGVVEFDEDHAYVVGLESHNHPSAIEPYGGAATGIGGIVRDVVCMGATPLAFTDPLFFARPDYPVPDVPAGVKHPRYLLSGVVSGIRDYGNRIGVPTVAGMVAFHDDYLGNCLVNVGCVGMVPKKEIIHSRVGGPDDLYILVGGKTGRDGIHGVTFASAELTASSEEEDRGSVQLGDPITKEPLMHAILEANSRELLHGLKDLGGGGLSCVAGEMALSAGLGALVELDKVPLKEEGLDPWEIWVSESQERFMLAVEPHNVDAVMEIFDRWDVLATRIGHVLPHKNVQVTWKGETIVDMDLEFLTGGPMYCRRYESELPMGSVAASPHPPAPQNNTATLLSLLGDPNIGDKSWVIRQYDHEVKAVTAVKPLVGEMPHYSHGDASVLKPLVDSMRGLALSTDVNPFLMQADPYWGAVSAFGESCRNLVAVGAKPHSSADCLNFGNPEKPDRLGQFHSACRGLGDIARHLVVPFISGNVSFYNEAFGRAIPPTPTIMTCGIIDDVRKAVTADIKGEGNSLFLIGMPVTDELGGAALWRHLVGGAGPDGEGLVPSTDLPGLAASMELILDAIDQGLVRSCHDVSEGGLAVCLAEMAMGGGIGGNVDLDLVPSAHMGARRSEYSVGGRGGGDECGDECADGGCETPSAADGGLPEAAGLPDHVVLFSESSTRWLLEVSPGDDGKLSAMADALADKGVRTVRVGSTGGGDITFTRGGVDVLRADIPALRDAFVSAITGLMRGDA